MIPTLFALAVSISLTYLGYRERHFLIPFVWGLMSCILIMRVLVLLLNMIERWLR